MSATENPMDGILRTAIQREIDAYTLYHSAAEASDMQHARDMLNDLAAQEVGHRTRLEALLNGRAFKVVSKTQQRKIADLKITDYLVEEPLSADSDFQSILIVAGKRERASHELYSALARVAEDDETKKLFEFLANEEASHKYRVEALYDKIVYKEN
ncbi:MAG: ferritin-like domain-containing protein [Anaerolineae bacterium]